jgi:hypothetical protein
LKGDFPKWPLVKNYVLILLGVLLPFFNLGDTLLD